MDRSATDRSRMIPLPRCPFCHEDVARGQVQLRVCPRCHAFHHDECWTEAEGCSSCAPVIRITVPAEPVTGDGTPARAPLESAPPPSPVERAPGRCRRAKAAVAGAVLLALGFGLEAAWGVATRPRPRHDPEAAVQDYFAAYRAARARFERDNPTLDALSTPLSTDLAAMEHGRFDEPLAETATSSEVVARALTNEPLGARVVAGARSFRLLPDGQGGWLLDRTLSETPVVALGIRMRLPLGLEPTGERHGWRQGELAALLGRQELDSPLATAPLAPRLGGDSMAERTIGVLQLEAGGGALSSTVRRDELPPRRLGAATRVFVGESAEGVTAIGYVEVAPGSVLSLELRGPAGHQAAVVELLRASLGTIEFFPDGAHERAPWIAQRLDDRSTVRVPPGFGREGEKIEHHAFARDSKTLTLAELLGRAPSSGLRHDRHEAAGQLLSHRDVYLVPVLDEGMKASESWVVVASGIVDGRGLVVTLTASAGRHRSRVALERLERIADTFETRAQPAIAGDSLRKK